MKRQVEVYSIVEVEVDETKFTPEFISNFKRYFYDIDTLEEHIEYLAELKINQCITFETLDNGKFGEFIEGYGLLKDMGIKINVIDQNAEIREEQ